MRSSIICTIGIILSILSSLTIALEHKLSLDPLPYAYNALEPYIDAETMNIHYNRHHQGYYNNLAKALQSSKKKDSSLEEILANVSKYPVVIRNNAGGHYNHTLFWKIMSPDGGGTPSGALAIQIDSNFGSFSNFQQQFKQEALSRFGSGWVWLCVADDGTLFVSSTGNQDNPLMDITEEQGTPILALDVWEHAYYLKYQNQRGRYIDAFWQVVNWQQVANNFEKAQQQFL